MSPRAATRFSDQEIAACRDTNDFKEGVQHFLEKRAPTHWTMTWTLKVARRLYRA